MGEKVKTIIDIARLANVSKSTVSRALINDPKIKLETRLKIIEIINKYDYQRNDLARSLKTKRTNTIGVILADIGNPFYFDIIRGIDEITSKNKYNIILSFSDYKIDKEIENIRTLVSKRVDGIIACLSWSEQETIEKLKRSKIPFILLDTPIKKMNSDKINYIYSNPEKSGFLITKYLIDKGHKNIAIVVGPKKEKGELKFVSGYKKALEHSGISINNKIIKKIILSLENAYESTVDLLKSGNNFSAIITIDYLSISLYKAIKELGLNIPKDISVIGNDNIPLAKYLDPSLTTLEQPKYELGKLAAEHLVNMINQNNMKDIALTLTPQIIERNSVRNLIE